MAVGESAGDRGVAEGLSPGLGPADDPVNARDEGFVVVVVAGGGRIGGYGSAAVEDRAAEELHFQW